MTKEQEEAIEMFKKLEMGDDKEFVNARETILSMLEEKDKEISQLKKGIHSLMQSRRKWKYRYYKMKKKNNDLEKSVEQIYEDYQDIGKMAFDYSDRIELLEKQIDLMAEEIDKSIGNTCPLADYNYNLNCEKECNDDYKKCWKQYFENKAKEYLKER